MMKKIRLSKSTIGQEEKDAVMEVLNKEYLGMGEEVKLFEEELKAYIGTEKDVICVNTGTAALHLALQACNIKRGDEVLVPSMTFVASFQAVSATGATPAACDIIENSLFLDIKDAEKRLTKNTRAVMPVHYASDSQYIDEVYSFAEKYGLRVIEDAAHSFGSTRNGNLTGSTGDILCFSFDGIKNITSGEGGAVVTGDREIARKIKNARLLGVENDTEKRYAGLRSWEFDVKEQGYRYHMSNIMAAIGRAQLKKIDIHKRIRQKIASRYLEKLRGIKGLALLELDYQNIVPHIFVIKVLDFKKEDLRDFLMKNNIECGIHYYPNHLLTKYRTEYSLPVTEKVYEQILTLPLQLDLTVEQQNYIITKIEEFFQL